jgi:hypothetical protein
MAGDENESWSRSSASDFGATRVTCRGAEARRGDDMDTMKFIP